MLRVEGYLYTTNFFGDWCYSNLDSRAECVAKIVYKINKTTGDIDKVIIAPCKHYNIDKIRKTKKWYGKSVYTDVDVFCGRYGFEHIVNL